MREVGVVLACVLGLLGCCCTFVGIVGVTAWRRPLMGKRESFRDVATICEASAWQYARGECTLESHEFKVERACRAAWGMELEVNTRGTPKLETVAIDALKGEVARLRAGGALPVHIGARGGPVYETGNGEPVAYLPLPTDEAY
jgi:hypothetical protein